MGAEATVHTLLSSGANPNTLDACGKSALSGAAESCLFDGSEERLQGYLRVCKHFTSITNDINLQDFLGCTALSSTAFYSRYGGKNSIIEVLLDAGAEIVPRQPGPHCPFLEPHERLEGFGRDALLEAWEVESSKAFETILKHAAGRDPDSEYAVALKLWGMDDRKDFEFWTG